MFRQNHATTLLAPNAGAPRTCLAARAAGMNGSLSNKGRMFRKGNAMKHCSIFFALVGTLTSASLVSAAVITAEADSFVSGRNGEKDNNYGSNSTIWVKLDTAIGSGTRVGFMRFDLSTAPATITSATLEMEFVTGGGTDSTGTTVWTFHVYGLNNGHTGESWTESAITWNTAPGLNSSDPIVAADTTDLGTFTRTGKGFGTVSFSSAALTSFLNADTDNQATIILARDTGPGGVNYIHGIASRENTTEAYRPTLTVIPEPAAAAMLGLGGLILMPRRRRM